MVGMLFAGLVSFDLAVLSMAKVKVQSGWTRSSVAVTRALSVRVVTMLGAITIAATARPSQ